MNTSWANHIIKNFDNASSQYENKAFIQKDIAKKLTDISSRYAIPNGIWADLGSGTGLLARSLELSRPGQNVYRIDKSKRMLEHDNHNAIRSIWDLNQGLPSFAQPPTLLASSFVLHWLSNPKRILQEWFKALAPKGFLVIALPIEGSFPEWYIASKNANVPCTAIKLPSEHSLISSIPSTNIQYSKIHTYVQKGKKMTSILKSMVNIGAHSSQQKSLSIGEWRKIQSNWPNGDYNKFITLTWLIHILVLQKN